MKSKLLFKCKISYNGSTIVDNILFIIAQDIKMAIKAAEGSAAANNPGARVIEAKEISSQLTEV